jgi:signal transduction histidine kinase
MLRVLVPVCAVLGAAIAATLRTIETSVEERMKDDVDLVARALQLPLIHAIERERDGSVREALRSAFGIGRVYGAYVFGPDGEIVASYGAATPGGPPERLTELVAEGNRAGEFGAVGGRRVYSSFVPLTDIWGRSLGLLQVTRRQSDFDEYVARLRLGALGALLLVMGVVTVLVLHGHHRAAIQPLGRLSDSMARVATGDTGHRAAERGPKEIANVAATFNRMLDALEASAQEVRRRREAQRELRRELASAEKLAAVGELSAGVAHELGAPLSVIDGRAQRLLRKTDLDGATRRDLGVVRTQVTRMEAIVRQLLEFGRAESGRKRTVDLATVMGGAVAASRDAARRAETRLEVRPPHEPVSVEADGRRLEEAVGNIVRNAVQAAPGGHVRVAWRRSEAGAELSVEDDGPGVPDEARGRIFDPFFTTKDSGQGTGLGLAVVHGVVEDHAGRIDVERSTLGGARFKVHLPVQADSPSPGPAA